MRKLIDTLLLLLCAFVCKAQIVAPDTVCVNSAVNLSTPYQSTAYTWCFDTVNFQQTPSPVSIIYSGGLVSPSFILLANDNGNFYHFISAQNGIFRLDRGSSPNNTPTILNLGTFGMPNSGKVTGMDIVKDVVNNKWYGLIINDYQLLRLDFGNSLANTPTSTLMSFPSNLLYGHQLTIKKYNGQWIVFVANRNGGISRFDFGSTLSNTPTAINLPGVGSIAAPVNFTLYEQSGNWYMIIANLSPAGLTRYNFGNNLLNNAPTGTYLGNPGNILNLPRGISIIKNCNSFMAYMINQGGEIIKMNFNNDITNTPTATNIGNTGRTGMGTLYPYTYNDSIYFMTLSFGTTEIYKFSILRTSTPVYTNYYNGNQTHTFTQPGTYNINLFCDQGYLPGPSTFCKKLVVLPAGGNTTRDTTICDGNPVTLQGNPSATGYLWNTGATTSTITVSLPGKYWVAMSGIQCGTTTDTINVIAQSAPVVALGNDTAFCQGNSVTLQSKNTYTGATYAWSTGANTSSINIATGGSYRLSVTQNKCTGRDTIVITINPLPVVSLGNDTTICQGKTLILGATAQPNTAYTWSTGASTSSISVTTVGTYWLLATTTANCKQTDTIHVQVNPMPVVILRNDTSFCQGNSITLQSTNTYTGATYAWSTGATTPSITANQTASYRLGVTVNGCTAYDTVDIIVKPLPSVALGNDTILCIGNSITLTSAQPIGSAYLWNTSSTGSSITVAQSGNYWLTVTSANGCSNRDTINLLFVPIPTISLGLDTQLCEGQSLTLVPVSTTGTTFLWNTGETTPSVTVTQSGTYWLRVDPNTCSNADSINVLFKPLPIVALGNDTSICKDSALILKSLQPATARYKWSTDSRAASITITQAGKYWLEVTNDGCTAADSLLLTISEKPTVTASNDTALCGGNILTLWGSTSEKEYEWSDGSTTPSITVDKSGIYYLSATNKCGTTRDTVKVDFLFCNIMLPNAFTPNGDGVNDILKVIGSIQDITNFSFSIYNRWGEVVFHTANKYEGWDGTYKGTPQSTGVFSYMLEFVLEGKSYFSKGNITLIR